MGVAVNDAGSHERLEREARKARLLLAAARYLGETLELQRVYERFRELVTEAVQHNGVVVSSYEADQGLIRCDYAWVDGALLDTGIFPPLTMSRSGGMQSQVIRSGEPLLVDDVRERVKGEGTYYDIDREGHVRKLPDSGEPGAQAAMMLPVRHEQQVVGVVQMMSDEGPYTREELELVEGLVGLMGAAVRNARLYREAQSEAAARARAETVAAEREHASRVLEAVGDGIMLVNSAGRIRFWNPAAEMITGVPRKRALGARATRIFPHWEQVSAQVPAAEADAPAQQVTLPVKVNRRDFWLAFVAVRSPEGCVYAFRDLTAEQSLEQAKSEFIATVSHELRTPLTGILGAAMTLLRRDIDFSPELRRELLEMIASQAWRLTRVTEEVLLASSIDSGTLEVEVAEVDVNEVVAETVESMRPRLPGAVAVRVRTRPAGLAAGDRDRVQQVLVNLLDNALKYSPQGGTVVVSTNRLRDVVRVAVRDEGIGIPPLEHGRVFEKFYRREPHLSHGPGGTGLGLYICRALLERMGGRIGVRSEPGRGSTFFFDLPPA